MKIVVIGGTGLIGTKLANRLRREGHEVVAASPATGVNAMTGEGLAEALAGAQVVVDVANSPSFEDRAVLEFFETSGRNLLAAEAAEPSRHGRSRAREKRLGDARIATHDRQIAQGTDLWHEGGLLDADMSDGLPGGGQLEHDADVPRRPIAACHVADFDVDPADRAAVFRWDREDRERQ